MKSLFLQKLSELLIPDKETDCVDLYNLQSIDTWPLFKIAFHNSEDVEIFYSEKVIDQSQYKPEDIDFLGLDYSEIVEFNENYFIIDTGGEWQGLYRVIISLNKQNELYVQSCEIVPELSEEENGDTIFHRHSEEEYEIILENLQIILESQD